MSSNSVFMTFMKMQNHRDCSNCSHRPSSIRLMKGSSNLVSNLIFLKGDSKWFNKNRKLSSSQWRRSSNMRRKRRLTALLCPGAKSCQLQEVSTVSSRSTTLSITPITAASNSKQKEQPYTTMTLSLSCSLTTATRCWLLATVST